MSKVIIIGGGAAGMMAGNVQPEMVIRQTFLKKTKNWEKNFILQEKADVNLTNASEECVFR
jgi:predicted flavoprotein YhiN